MSSRGDLRVIMPLSQRENKIPDAEAIEDDERQYGHGPLSAEELDQKCVSSTTCGVHGLTILGIQIDLIITQKLCHFMSSSLHCLILSMIIKRNQRVPLLLVRSKALTVPTT